SHHVFLLNRSVVFFSPQGACMLEFPRELAPKLLASGSFRWLLPEVAFAEKPAHHIFQHPPGCSDLSIAVAWLSEKLLGKRIDHHIARPGIERDHLVERCSLRQRRHGVYAVYIPPNPANLGVAIKKVIEVRKQRRDSTARRHLRGTNPGYPRHTQLHRHARPI